MSDYVERLWAKVRRGEGCWLWTGARTPKGYGSCTVNGRRMTPHRLAYQAAFGPVPPGSHILHRCDNPACVRPDHLFRGTNADNIADKVAKGRQLHGEQIACHKLTVAQVREIRRRYAEGAIGYRRLAREFGVSKGAILCVVRRKNWVRA